MGSMSTDEILVHPLKKIKMIDGDVLHALKKDDLGYVNFGEAYFSWINQNAIKAWKRHTKMTMNLIVPVGCVRFVFLNNNSSKVRVEEIGVDRYVRLSVPPGIWFGFQGLSDKPSLVLNIADILHDPDEVERVELRKFDFKWSLL
jgi:dTDP-4-dehydrorhamnose 3,5-epimerase